jgi:hypothetical protein
MLVCTYLTELKLLPGAGAGDSPAAPGAVLRSYKRNRL